MDNWSSYVDIHLQHNDGFATSFIASRASIASVTSTDVDNKVLTEILYFLSCIYFVLGALKDGENRVSCYPVVMPEHNTAGGCAIMTKGSLVLVVWVCCEHRYKLWYRGLVNIAPSDEQVLTAKL